MAKHPVPKKKTSKARGSRRYKAFQNKARVRLENGVQLTDCPNCGSTVRMHHLCDDCGFYRGQDMLNKASKADAKLTKIQA